MLDLALVRLPLERGQGGFFKIYSKYQARRCLLTRPPRRIAGVKLVFVSPPSGPLSNFSHGHPCG
jgi:hypothetical protein